jgi:type II secretory pathway pseudopilin PulG
VGRPAGPRRGAFTLIELLFVVAMVVMLIGLLLWGVNKAVLGARKASETNTVASLRMGVDQFKGQFGFIPPLVRDNRDGSDDGPLDANGIDPLIYRASVLADAEFLRGDTGDPKDRYSIYSLPYYLIGVLDEVSDGIEGPGFLEPRRDGTFTKRSTSSSRTGRVFDPFFDASAKGIATVNREEGRIELRNDKGAAYRYYRWLKDEGDIGNKTLQDYLNVPLLLGDPEENAELKSAEYAILSAGANGVFGDEDVDVLRSKLGLPAGTSANAVRRKASGDNVIGVGR